MSNTCVGCFAPWKRVSAAIAASDCTTYTTGERHWFMFRHLICLVTAAGFIASDMAIIPHAHGSGSQDNQRGQATPHFHCAWSEHDDHAHDHNHGGHRHSHAGHKHERNLNPPHVESTSQSRADGLWGDDHDANAIYLPGQICAVSQSCSKHSLALVVQFWGSATLPVACSEEQGGGCSSSRWRPPDKVLDLSDTYLTLRNLRI